MEENNNENLEKVVEAGKEVAKEVAKEIPLEYLLIETDAPYLAPHPYRGKVNYPYYVKLVAEEIARLRGIEYQELEEITSKNACDLFSL